MGSIRIGHAESWNGRFAQSSCTSSRRTTTRNWPPRSSGPAAPRNGSGTGGSGSPPGSDPAPRGWAPTAARERVPDGDFVIVRPPPWFERWLAGGDEVRVTADARCRAYGQYKD